MLRSSHSKFNTNMNNANKDSQSQKPSIDKGIYNLVPITTSMNNSCHNLASQGFGANIGKENLTNVFNCEKMNGDEIPEDDDDAFDLRGDDSNANEAKKRRRKSNIQLRILKSELDNNSENWSKEKIFKVSKLTGLSESQVYKWCWDQKKKRDDIDAKKKSAQGVNNMSNFDAPKNTEPQIGGNSDLNFGNKKETKVFGTSYKQRDNIMSQSGIYSDMNFDGYFYEDDKENYMENQNIINKPIRKLSGNTHKHSIYSDANIENIIDINGLKRESLVYKGNHYGGMKEPKNEARPDYVLPGRDRGAHHRRATAFNYR